MRRHEIPGVPGVLTPEQCRQTAESIAATQESSGALPWFDGGHTDPWDHVENAMALTVAGLWEPARAAFDWCRDVQRADGSMPIQMRNGVLEDGNSDSNFCAYVATGVWHHVLVTGDRGFAETMWPVVSRAIDFVLTMQLDGGEIAWARSECGHPARGAADRLRQHLPQHPLRAGAGELRRRIAAGVGGRGRQPRPRDRRASRGVQPQGRPRDGVVLPGARWCAARRRRQGPHRRAVGPVRRAGSRHPLRRPPAVGDRAPRRASW